MSYQGFGNTHMPIDTVDEVADYTDMMGGASVINQKAQSAEWRSNPTKMLVVLWVFVLTLYWLTGYFFRRQLG